MKYRVGLDVGTNSLGVAIVELTDGQNDLQPSRIDQLGVRIFSDGRNPKDKSSNAEARRVPRGARRNRDRALHRKRKLMDELIDFDLMPTALSGRKVLEALDPWMLRAQALESALPLHHVGRALFHLNQRRGFKSNRKTDNADEKGKVYSAISATQAAMIEEKARTLGELFGRPRLEIEQWNKEQPQGARKPLPLARVRSRGEGAKAAYDYYPTRALIMDEFHQIWNTQAPHHPQMTETARKILAHRIEYQRPLKAQPVGKCTLIETEARAPKALPSAQKFRVLSEVNNLMVGKTGERSRNLADEERETLYSFLLCPTNKTAKRSFDQIRNKLGLSPSDRFNLESEKRNHLIGDETAGALKDSWGPAWHELSLNTQDEVILKLLNTEDPKAMLSYLMENYGFDENTAQTISDTSFKAAYGQFSQAAISRLIPELEKGLTYDKAVISAGFKSHSLLGDGAIYDGVLPYYGEVLSRHVAFAKPAPLTGDDTRNAEEKAGKIANPTVHVALNEIGKVLNDIMKIYGGPPAQVVMEMARDLPLSARGKSELERKQSQNQKQNEENRKTLLEYGASDRFTDRLKLRLYNELPATSKYCIYSGTPISLSNLFTSEFEVDHILPYARTLNDGFSNKILCTRQANRDKGNLSPFEAFGDNAKGNWENISIRADALPANKRWRFKPDAIENYENGERDFLARQLTDTQYIARLAKRYVEAIYGGQGAKGQLNTVWVTPGRLTSDLRHYAGLNSLLPGHNKGQKDRSDHRHHAIDAAVIAFTDRAMVKGAADQAKLDNVSSYHELMKRLAAPLAQHRDAIGDALNRLTVSHKPDHGYQGAMHNDTAYGVTDEIDDKKQAILVTRKPIESFEKPADLEKIRDHHLKLRFLEATQGLSGKDFKKALAQEASAQHPPVRRVRITVPMKTSSFVTIGHDGNSAAKAYKGDGNYCYDIWNDKSKKDTWTGEVITRFQAYQMARENKEWWRKPFGRSGQKLIMRLRVNDMVEIEDDNKKKIVRVCQITPGKVIMIEHFEANVDARTRSGYKGDNPLKYIFKAPSSLQKAKAMRVTVSPAGKVRRHKAA